MRADLRLIRSRDGSEPPTMDPMEARVAKLEQIAEKTGERLTAIETRLAKIETRIEALASKDELHKAMNEQTWRIVGAMITFGSLLAAAVFFIARNVH